MAKKRIVLIWAVLLVLQIILLWNYIGIIHWGHIKIRFNASTGPNSTVTGGYFYLKSISPDSVKNKSNIDFTEVWHRWENFPFEYDLEATEYIVKAQVIGTKKEMESSITTYPVLKITSWEPINPFIDFFAKILIPIELLIFMMSAWSNNNKMKSS